MRENYDVIVVGGGVLGASTAYHCCREGLRVLLLEKDEALAGTSGATFAWCGAHLKNPAAYNLMSQEAIGLYEGLEAELDADLEYGRVGSISLLAPEEFAEAAERVKALREEGYALELLDGPQARALEPAIPESYGGAIHCPIDVEINPFLLVPAYLRKAGEMGARIRFREEVIGIESEGAAHTLVATAAGEYRAGRVVLAGGIHSVLLGELIGRELPVRQSRGQILVTERAPRILNGFVGLRKSPSEGGFMMRQVRSGNVLVGFTEEEVAFDRSVTPEGIGLVARNAAAGLPALLPLQVIRVYAGIRPMPEDGLPILSEIPGRPGLILTVTHSGYTLSVLVGRTVARHITGKDQSGYFETYGLQRFSEKEAAEAAPRPAPAGSFGGGAT